MEVTVEFLNLEAVLAQLSAYADGAQGRIEGVINDSLQTIASAAQAACPAKTGELKSSIGVVQGVDGGIGGSVVATDSVSPFLEFGTGSFTQIPPGMEEYAATFETTGGGHMPAQPFLYPAFFNEEPNVLEKLKEVL